MPRFVWHGEDLEILPVKIGILMWMGFRYVVFHVSMSLAIKMDWLRYNSTTKKYELGGNLSPRIPWDEQSKTWIPPNDTEIGPNDLWSVEGGLLKFSVCLEWVFTNLNLAFRDVVGEPSRDVFGLFGRGGQQLHPLLREVEYRQQGAGVAYFEPTHMQWMPCRREYLDIVEVSVGESQGGLVKFGPGRTIVTLMFKRDV